MAKEETVIAGVLERLTMDLSSSNFMDTIRSCIPLHGEAIIQRWKQQAQAYPDELAVRQIQEHLTYFQPGQLELYARRDNPTALYGLISGLQKRVFLVLLALNHRYFPTFKWMYRSLEVMSIKPTDMIQRFRQAFSDPPEAAIKDTIRVLGETLMLVEQHYPQIDTAQVRRRLALARIAQGRPVHLKEQDGYPARAFREQI